MQAHKRVTRYTCIVMEYQHKGKDMLIIYRGRKVRLQNEALDDIHIPSDTIPMVAKACISSNTTFCFCIGKFSQSVRL